jgi:integrase
MPTSKNKKKGKKPPRRKKGTGSIRPHGRGFEAAITVLDPETGRKSRPSLTFATDWEAEEWLDEQVLKIKRGRSRELLGIPFTRLVEEYRKDRKRKLAAGQIGQDQFDADEGRIENHLLPYFMNRPISEMDVYVIEGYRDDKLAGTAAVAVDEGDGAPLAQSKLAPQTVIHHLSVLRGMFRIAQKLKWVSDNPVELVDNPPLNRPNVEALTQVEVRKVLILIPAEKRNLTLVQLHLGLRSGEARGIRKPDISIKADGSGELRVRGQVKRVKVPGAREAKLAWVEKPKTKHGWRTIPFGSDFGAVLKAQIGVADERPDPEHEELIFRTGSGQPLSGDNYRNQVYMPAVSAALFKLMTNGQRRRLLKAVPDELQLPTEMLALDDVSINNVLTGTWDDYDVTTHEFSYIDGDGEERVAKVPAALHQRLIEQKRDLEEGEIPNKRNYLFPGKKSMQIRTQDFLSTVFRKAWKEAAMAEDRRLHRLRHTYASAMAGEIELKDLQHFIGHGRMSTTADLYVHFYERKNAPLGDTMNLYRDTEGD